MKCSSRKGFTFFELLIVMSIIAILLMVGITNWKSQLERAYDAQRKGDLSRLKAALEHYSIDNGCYPSVDQMVCTSTIFSPYNMPTVLCDPVAKIPYYYQPVDLSTTCLGYRLYTVLRRTQDPDIQAVGCNRPGVGCGVIGHAEYNYGVSSGMPVAQ
jgi:prepilin-type N-terminal cleavage/methylation domain-containing protein